jgi:hypothetical protein
VEPRTASVVEGVTMLSRQEVLDTKFPEVRAWLI